MEIDTIKLLMEDVITEMEPYREFSLKTSVYNAMKKYGEEEKAPGLSPLVGILYTGWGIIEYTGNKFNDSYYKMTPRGIECLRVGSFIEFVKQETIERDIEKETKVLNLTKLQREVYFWQDPRWRMGFIWGSISAGLTWLPKLIHYLQHS